MAEGNETPGGDPPRRSEGDLLAERRARRAAESGEQALTRRAEVAEATVLTLETHVASLQQRLREAEEESRRISDLIEAEQASSSGPTTPPPTPPSPPPPSPTPPPPAPPPGLGAPLLERELRRVRQREYAEQRLRVEAEDRCVDLECESRAEIDQLARRLSASERGERALAARLEGVQRELAEAEQAAAAAERAASVHAERALRERFTELERRAGGLERELELERDARERAERALESMRRGHRQVEGVVGELADVLARLKGLAATGAAATGAAATGTAATGTAATGTAATAPPAQAPGGEGRAPAGQRSLPQEHRLAPSSGPVNGENAEMADALAAAVERLRARVVDHPERAPAPVARRPAHKHSMSLVRRLRIARKQRRER
jgi:hypothetical protein